MAVTHANSKHYDKMAGKVGKDSHVNADPVHAAAMPKGMTSGRNGGKADRTMAPAPKGKGYGC